MQAKLLPGNICPFCHKKLIATYNHLCDAMKKSIVFTNWNQKKQPSTKNKN